MSSTKPIDQPSASSRLASAAASIVGGLADAARQAPAVTHAAPARRAAQPSTARSRISAVKPKRAVPMTPTPERLQHGDIAIVGGVHTSMPVIERLYRDGKLDKDAGTAEGMFMAAEKLYRHYVAAGLVGVKAQDLNRVIAHGPDGLEREENWVHHHDTFAAACKLMGWSDANPRRGAGRMVVAVVCHEQTVRDAAVQHVGPGRLDPIQAVGMDRLREGLFALAREWRFC